MEQVTKIIKELFNLSNCEVEQNGITFYLNTKGFKDNRNNAQYFCDSKDNKYHLVFYCDTRDTNCYDAIAYYRNVINNLLTKLSKKESEGKTMAIKIEKIKKIQNKINKLETLLSNLERFDNDLIEEKAREEYLEETQTRLESEMQESEELNTSALQLAAKLTKFSPNYETWKEYIGNKNCSEQWNSYIGNKALSVETLKSHLASLEVPYKMYRRIKSYLKKHQ